MRKYLAALTLAGLFFGLLSCSGRNTDGGKKIVHFSMSDDVKSADPATVNDALSVEMTGNIFEGLVTYSYLGPVDHIEPLLAEALPEISKDEKTYTFKIKSGVLFQDHKAFNGGKGREVTAEDFIYALKRVGDPRLSSANWWTFDGLIVGFNEWRDALEKSASQDAKARQALFEKPIAGLSATDAHTLVLKLTRPYPQLLYVLAMPHSVVVAREVVEARGPEVGNDPIGTGPFRLKEWIRGSKISLEKNPTFRQDVYPSNATDEEKQLGLAAAAGKKVPFIDELHWDIIKEEQPRWLKFRRGDLDESGVPKESFLEVVDASGQLQPDFKKANIQLQREMSLTTWWIEFNLKDPLLGKNIKLRQALSMAFDRKRALELLYNNRGILISSLLPISLEGARDLPPAPFDTNIEKAKKALSEAGYPDGKNLPELTFDLRGPGTNARQLGELIIENFSKIGVKCKLLQNSFPEALEKARSGRFQLMLGGWSADYPDSENFLQLFYGKNAASGTNTSAFINPAYDKLYEQIRTQRQSPAREKAIRQMNDLLTQEVPVIFFYQATDYRLSQPRLKNYKHHLLLGGVGKFLDLDVAAKK